MCKLGEPMSSAARGAQQPSINRAQRVNQVCRSCLAQKSGATKRAMEATQQSARYRTRRGFTH